MQPNSEFNAVQNKKPSEGLIKRTRAVLRHRLNKALGQQGIICSMRAGFGNQLFIYCFSRILAERYGLQMECFFNKRPASEFEKPSGFNRRSQKEYAIKNFFNVDNVVEGKTLSGKPKVMAMYNIAEDWVPQRPINTCGYFQIYSHFKPYKDKIKFEWLRIQDIELPNVSDDTLCVHVRLSDYVSKPSPWHLKFSYYKKAIESTKWRDVVLVTDSPNHEIIKGLEKTFGARVVSSKWSEDFKFMMAHKKIVISDSSFSWWAAWLSEANEVIASGPNLDNEKYGGFWARRGDIDLYCDEPGWRFIE